MKELRPSHMHGFFVLAGLTFGSVLILIPAINWAFVKVTGKKPADVLTFGKKTA